MSCVLTAGKLHMNGYEFLYKIQGNVYSIDIYGIYMKRVSVPFPYFVKPNNYTKHGIKVFGIMTPMNTLLDIFLSRKKQNQRKQF